MNLQDKETTEVVKLNVLTLMADDVESLLHLRYNDTSGIIEHILTLAAGKLDLDVSNGFPDVDTYIIASERKNNGSRNER